MSPSHESEIYSKIIVKGAIILHFLVFFAWGLSRHWGFMTSLNDLGHFDQAVWGTLNGDVLLNSDLFTAAISRLGIHFDPILFFFVPLYAIWADVSWFTLAQSLAISLSAWPIYLFARDVTRSDEIACAWTLAYLLNPFLLNAGAWDFHPVSLAVPFVAWGLLAVERNHFKQLLVCSLVILTCKEHFGIMIVGFGFLWLIRNRSLQESMILTSLGFLHFFLVLKVIMPLFSPTGDHLMMSENLGQLSRYGWMGESVGEIIALVFSHPLSVIDTVFTEFNGFLYLSILLLFFLAIPLAGIEFILPGLADLAANLLSANNMPRSVFAYHSITLIPILTCAAIWGAKRVCLSGMRPLKGVTSVILAVNLICGYLLSPFPLPHARNIWDPSRLVNLPESRLDDIHALIPPDASVSAQANVGAHFSQRKRIYLYPDMIGDADFLVLRLENPTKSVYTGNFRPHQIFFHHFQQNPDRYIRSIWKILETRDYSIAYWNPPWLVFSKESGDDSQRVNLKIALEKLESEWIKPLTLNNGKQSTIEKVHTNS